MSWDNGAEGKFFHLPLPTSLDALLIALASNWETTSGNAGSFTADAGGFSADTNGFSGGADGGDGGGDDSCRK